MLINLDAKALEWFGAVYLSGDKVGYKEITAGIDQHAENQKVFGLGEGDDGRLVAKKFVFRLIYGGQAETYASDAEFTHVSDDPKFWRQVIDRFYTKYSGIAEWHDKLMLSAMEKGQIEIPTGRIFRFKQEESGNWPRTKILNYPVQGFGADLMVLARVSLWRHLRTMENVKWVCTVHDSIVLDAPKKEVLSVIRTVYDVWNALPQEFEKRFKVPLDLQPKVEVSYGVNWKDQKKVTEDEARSLFV